MAARARRPRAPARRPCRGIAARGPADQASQTQPPASARPQGDDDTRLPSRRARDRIAEHDVGRDIGAQLCAERGAQPLARGRAVARRRHQRHAKPRGRLLDDLVLSQISSSCVEEPSHGHRVHRCGAGGQIDPLVAPAVKGGRQRQRPSARTAVRRRRGEVAEAIVEEHPVARFTRLDTTTSPGSPGGKVGPA